MENMKKLKVSKHADFIRFCVIGCSAYFIDVGLFWLLHSSSFLYKLEFVPNIISTGVSLNYTFFMNKIWTFRNKDPYSPQLVAKYVIKTLLYMLASYGALKVIGLSGLDPKYCKAIVPSVMAVFNYYADKRWVFKNNKKIQKNS